MPVMRSAAGGLNVAPRQRDIDKRKSMMKGSSSNDDSFGTDVTNSAHTKRSMSNNSSNNFVFGSEKTLKVTIRMSEKKERNQLAGGIFYKDDEARFDQQYTLKLKTFSEYNVTMEVEPAQDIAYVKLGGRNHQQFEQMNNPVEDGKTVCNFVWSTKQIKITDRKHRTVLPCVIKFKPYKELNFKILVKFYNNDEIAHYTGEPLSFIDLDCKVGSGKEKATILNLMKFN